MTEDFQRPPNPSTRPLPAPPPTPLLGLGGAVGTQRLGFPLKPDKDFGVDVQRDNYFLKDPSHPLTSLLPSLPPVRANIHPNSQNRNETVGKGLSEALFSILCLSEVCGCGGGRLQPVITFRLGPHRSFASFSTRFHVLVFPLQYRNTKRNCEFQQVHHMEGDSVFFFVVFLFVFLFCFPCGCQQQQQQQIPVLESCSVLGLLSQSCKGFVCLSVCPFVLSSSLFSTHLSPELRSSASTSNVDAVQSFSRLELSKAAGVCVCVWGGCVVRASRHYRCCDQEGSRGVSARSTAE